MDTAHLIMAERRRRIRENTLLFDDAQDGGELLLAALAYMSCPGGQIWPWGLDSFDQSKDPIQNLVFAGAMVAAEGDRLLRRREAGLPVVGGMLILGADPDKMVESVDGLREINSEMKKLSRSVI